MNAFKFAQLVVFGLVSRFAIAAPSLTSDALRLLDSANRQADHGERSRAKADLDCLLMPYGITIGMETSGAMAQAVEKGVRVWSERLPGCPFHFTTDPDAAIKVRFVDEIQQGGDVQGELHIHRYVRWGHGTASYHVTGTIQVRDNADGHPLRSSEVSAVVEHELGHLLGLDDESEAGVLMGPFVPGHPVEGPTDEEVSMVENFRADVRRAIADLYERSSFRRP